MIVLKIQRPLATNMVVPLAMVYNQDRTIQFTVPFIVVQEYFTSVDLKVYVEAVMKGTQLVVVKKVDPRPW